MIRHPITAEQGAWKIEIHAFDTGIEERYVGTNAIERAGDGWQFVEVNLTLSNTTSERRRFAWTACSLDSSRGDFSVDNSYEKRFGGMAWVAVGDDEAIEPHSTVERKLNFLYPLDEVPSVLACKSIQVTLDLTPPE